LPKQKKMINYKRNNLVISVIIPVYNDPLGLNDTLKSIENQDFHKENYEIIVADNGSDDKTLDIANEYTEKYPEFVKLVIEDKIKSSYAARNKGIKVSTGDIIAFIDADMTVEKDWLKKIVESFKTNNADYMGYKVEIPLKDNSIFGLYNKITGFPIESYMNKFHFAPTCCLIVKRKVFDKFGLFDSRLISSGDLEFGTRVFRNGIIQHYNPEIIARHPSRSTLKQIIRKNFRIGRGSQQLAFFYPDNFIESKRSVFHFRHYLPSKPWTFCQGMNKNKLWNNLNLLAKIQLYLIHWGNKLAIQAGYIYEKTKIKYGNG